MKGVGVAFTAGAALACLALLNRRPGTTDTGKVSKAPKRRFQISYWKIRGLGAPLRMMAHYAGEREDIDIEYIDYDAGDPQSEDYKQAWISVKEGLKESCNPMINLPYIQVKNQNFQVEETIVQTNACLYFLGREFGLDGSSTFEKSRIDQVVAQSMDWRNSSISYFYGRNTGDVKEYITQKLFVHYEKLNNFMKKNGLVYTASNSVTLADFHVWEMIDQHEAWFNFLNFQSILSQYPNLQKFHQLLRKSCRLQKYFESKYYKEYAMNNPHGKFLH